MHGPKRHSRIFLRTWPRLFLLSTSALLALGGCATPRQQATRYSSPVLCYGVYAGNNVQKEAASGELAARGFTCDEQAVRMGYSEWQQLQANRQAQSDRDLAAAAILLGSRPPAYVAPPPPTPIRCTSQRIGNQTYTNCY